VAGVSLDMSTDATTLAHDAAPLPDDPAVLRQMIRELVATVAQLRNTVDKQSDPV
jgi:hypothetical protein